MRGHVAASPAVALVLLLSCVVVAGAQSPPRTAPPEPVPVFTDTGGVTLRGVVRDTAGRPLVGAQVSAAGATTITEADGRFELRDVRADTIHFLVRRIGHEPAALRLAPPGGLIVDVVVTLVPNVVELGTIVIDGRALDRRLWTEGYYRRAALGHGTYLGPEELGRYSSLETALRMVPSVRMERSMDGRVMAFGRTATGVCPLVVHVDGVLVRWANDVGIQALAGPGEVHAVEVYARAAQVPAMLRTVGVAGSAGMPNARGVANAGPVDCGAILVWTKAPGA